MKSYRRRSVVVCLLVSLVAATLVGCGGGGKSAGYRGRSFSAEGPDRALYVSVDTVGRFTLIVRDASSIPSWAGAQGAFGPNDQFFAQTPDGLFQFEGNASASGDAITCVVRRSGSTLFSVTAHAAPQGTATPMDLIGTYLHDEGGDAALLTLDASGHGALWVNTSTVNGASAVTVSGTGALSSASGDTVGKVTVLRADATLEITRLNGQSVALSLPLSRTTRAKWTFMVFINAANDLQQFGPLNVNQMEKVGSSADLNIVVQWKQANCTTCGNPAWVGTRRYYITRDQNTSTIGSQLVQEMGPNVDMGDWRELNAFIRWTQQRYPADRYALVIWDHGAGWRSTRAAGRAVRSVSIDDSTGNEIQTWELPQALNTSPKMDLLIFDASLMQMTEVAYEVRDMAKLMVGSEESPPGEGYVYDAFLKDLAASPTMTPEQFATQIVNRTVESYGPFSNITQSAVDLSRMQTVAERLDAFAKSLQFYGAENAAALISARQNAESYLYRDNKDLWHYAELVRTGVTTPALQTAASRLQEAVASAVIAEAHGNLHPNSHGLAVYLPSPASYLISYSSTALSRVTDWDTWLQNQPPG